MKLKFLGTGGGRFVTGMQRRKTSGIILESEETQIHIDPGPGALVETHENGNPGETEAVLVSHAHLDHVNDASALIEMMTQGYDKPGAVFASESVLEGYGDLERWISDYHKGMLSRVEKLEDGTKLEFKDLEVESQQMFHTDPTTQGFKISNSEKKIGFWTDTEYSEELVDFYHGCDTLIVYCNKPRGESHPQHTSLHNIPEIVEGSDISTVIVTHFGYRFLDADLKEQQEWLENQIDAKVVFAEDGMEFPGNRKLGDF